MSAQHNLTEQDYELLSAYLDGALSEAERADLESRLMDENDLRQELEALRQTVALVKGIQPLSAPRDYTLTADMVQPPRWIIFPTTATFSAVAAAAAMLLLLFGTTLLIGQNGGSMLSPAASNLQREQDSQSEIAAQPTNIATIIIEEQDDILLASAIPQTGAGEDGFNFYSETSTVVPQQDFTMEFAAPETPVEAVEPPGIAPPAPQSTQAAAPEEELGAATGTIAQEAHTDEGEAANAPSAAMADTAAQQTSETASSERETIPATTTVTASPTPTASHTPMPTDAPTAIATVSPPTPAIPADSQADDDKLLAPAMVLLGLTLLLIAAATTWIRVRRR